MLKGLLGKGTSSSNEGHGDKDGHGHGGGGGHGGGHGGDGHGGGHGHGPQKVKAVHSPAMHEHHHEETFFELFYDLIIVVVLMKLSYLKYEFTWFGIFTVVAIFGNFWSCWSNLNVREAYSCTRKKRRLLHCFTLVDVTSLI